jgi:hypothetical protein
VAPLRLGGLRGKKSTPSVWLGGTGGFFAVGKQEEQELVARSTRISGHFYLAASVLRLTVSTVLVYVSCISCRVFHFYARLLFCFYCV